MTLQKFWDKAGKHHYEGTLHIGPTSATHCTSCDGGKRPLAKGIAVHFTDNAGTAIFVTGPECFKKHTDITSLAQIPTIGFGFDDIALNRTVVSAPRLQTGFRSAVTDGITPRQQEAYANVLLRAKILPAIGFALRQPGLSKYLNTPSPYAEETLSDIERYVDAGIKAHGKPTLDQLFRAQYVAYQIGALKEKTLRPREKEFVESIEKTLKTRFGLTDKQMIALESAAERHNLHLQETGIRFPENQERFERSRRFNFKD